MKTLPRNLYTAEQSRQLDQTAIQQWSIPGYELMRRAATAAFRCMVRRWPNAVKIAVVCGPGNNGGDGFVIAQLAKIRGCRVDVLLVGDPDRIKGDAKTALQEMTGAGLQLQPFAEQQLQGKQLIVDALFGTGLDRSVEGEWAQAVSAINASGCAVLAVDIPSGLHADSGRILGSCVNADATISFIGLKQGLFTGYGPQCCGEVYFDDLSVPQGVYDDFPPAAQLVNWEDTRHWLTPRAVSAHKRQCGQILVVGGDAGMAGAPLMAGLAAYRAGAGLVTLLTHPSHATWLNTRQAELMVYGVEAHSLSAHCKSFDVMVIGPGLGTSDWSQAVFNAAMAAAIPKVVDADGLNLLASATRDNAPYRDDWILTPHPGEAGRLLGLDSATVQHDRFQAARQITQRYGGVCLLKGPGTIVVRGEHCWVVQGGNPGMAAGGMGDILSGVVGAIAGQMEIGAEAACVAATLHAAAGDEAAKSGQRGTMATDLLSPIRRLLN